MHFTGFTFFETTQLH